MRSRLFEDPLPLLISQTKHLTHIESVTRLCIKKCWNMASWPSLSIYFPNPHPFLFTTRLCQASKRPVTSSQIGIQHSLFMATSRWRTSDKIAYGNAGLGVTSNPKRNAVSCVKKKQQSKLRTSGKEVPRLPSRDVINRWETFCLGGHHYPPPPPQQNVRHCINHLNQAGSRIKMKGKTCVRGYQLEIARSAYIISSNGLMLGTEADSEKRRQRDRQSKCIPFDR